MESIALIDSGRQFSMSSIKRDVKKKVLPRPDPRFISRDPAHCSFASLKRFGLLSILVSFSPW
jgi:hypothetical protein